MKKFIALSALLFCLSQCGLKYTPAINTTDITKIDFNKDLEKSAKNCAYGILGFPPFAGSSVSGIEIAKDSGFTKVSAVDHQSDFFVIYNRFCTIVYGK